MLIPNTRSVFIFTPFYILLLSQINNDNHYKSNTFLGMSFLSLILNWEVLYVFRTNYDFI